MLRKTKIEIIKQFDTKEYPWCNSAFVISIKNGKALLLKENYGQNSDWDILSAITLSGQTLIQSQLPQCPTCAGLLATGYGIDKNSEEIKKVSNALNSEFKSLEKSIENIKPLLGLLKDGVYVVADIPSYPTDGSGNFFWAVSNKLKEVSATTETYFDSEDYSAIDGMPVFLYPSQSTDLFNQERIDYYLKTVSGKNAPRAIAYYVSGFISVLLDGHHKATAAALAGVLINCLTIIPVTSYQVRPFGEVYFSLFKIKSNDIPFRMRSKILFKKIASSPKRISEGDIIKKQWEQQYLSSARFFPNVQEITNQLCCNIGEITEKLIDECFSSITVDSAKKLRSIITILNRKNDSRCKDVALKCARLKIGNPQLGNVESQDLNRLREVAFMVLIKIKNDKDIEQFFIDFLIDDEEKHEQLKKIADSYWDNSEK